MKLNPDCVRAILLCIEEQSTCEGSLRFASAKAMIDEFPRLSAHSEEEVAYHVRQCALTGFFYKYEAYNYSTGFRVADLSPAGHAFIENIRQDNVWNIIKSKFDKIGSSSLSAISQIAANVISQIISSQLH